jgi:hypothetical protein
MGSFTASSNWNPDDTKVVPSSRWQIRVRPCLSGTQVEEGASCLAPAACGPLIPCRRSPCRPREHSDYQLNRWSRQQISPRNPETQRVIDRTGLLPTLGDADYSFPGRARQARGCQEAGARSSKAKGRNGQGRSAFLSVAVRFVCRR